MQFELYSPAVFSMEHKHFPFRPHSHTFPLTTCPQVYIKDVMSKKPGTSVAPTIISATPVMSKTTTIVNRQQQRIIGQTSVSSLSHSAVHQQQKHQQQQQQQQQLTVTNNNATTTTTLSSDFLSSIMQASGITVSPIIAVCLLLAD